MLKTELQQYIHASRYARYRDEDQRRETWEETVARYFDFFDKHIKENFSKKALHWYRANRDELEKAVLDAHVMPSMRCLMTAGPALERDHVAGYNCSYTPVDNIRVFDEIMYILLCGTGVGFSVERQYIGQLPTIPEELHDSDTVVKVADSKIGWATALREVIHLLYAGKVPKWDTSKVRPAGSRLKTFGGRASGPEPLEELFRFAVHIFRGAVGRKLNSLEVHDLVCKIADVVVVGGVRRSALLSLSNLTDERMQRAKSGSWWESTPHRALANNSVAYTEKPDTGIFLREWQALYESRSGERGIFSRVASKTQVSLNGRRDPNHEWGTNPCSEIILRPKQFCNLSEVVARSEDTIESLKAKVFYATILGTIQCTLTDFRYLSSTWKRNTEEERLLGVSITGILDSPLLNSISDATAQNLLCLKEVAIETNKNVADILGIPRSTAITCVKPSGTVSQLVDAASGIHPRHSQYYIRTIRADKKDPLAQLMASCGWPHEDDVMKPDSNWVFSFPVKAPDGAVLRDNVSAIEQLELWRIYLKYWCEHKPSITVTVRESEWLEVGAWVFANFGLLSGVAFLPHTDHVYKQAPYQACTKEQFESLLSKTERSPIAWDMLGHYDKVSGDTTTGTQELACVSGYCEV